MAERVIVLGGTRSGKSEVAETFVAAANQVVYVATGSESDAEMAERIAVHRDRRPGHWTTVETHDLAGAIRNAPAGSAVLVDALGPWLGARMLAEHLVTSRRIAVPLGREGEEARTRVLARAADFWAAAADHRGGPVVLVAEETGLGVIPAEAATRRFIDLAGDIVQQLSVDAERVVLVAAGRAIDLPPRAAALPLPPPDRAPWSPAGHRDRLPEALDFAVNVHGDSTPPHVRAALAEAAGQAHRYPDDQHAREAVATRHGRGTAEVHVTAGAAEAFWLLARVAAARHAVCVHPAFAGPEAALRAARVPVSHTYRRSVDGWRLDPAMVPADADLVVVGNPNNPTGTLDEADRVAALCRPGRLTVVDETFMDFVADDAASLAARADLPGLVVVRSVTKLWGLAGVRAGYLLAPPGLVARIAAARQPWPVAVPALAALVACLADQGYRREVADAVAAERACLTTELAALPGVTVAAGAANFLLVEVPDGPATYAGLRERGVAVHPPTFPGLDANHLRVTVRDAAQNRQLVDALAATLAAAP